MKPTSVLIGWPSLRSGSLLIAPALVCFGLAPILQAVGPDTDGAISGSNNGEGSGVLVNLTGGIWNTGTGFQALNHLTGGNQNTATGLRALFSDTSGGFNTATGVLSLFSNTSGFFNSATGAYALSNNTEGDSNTANGYGALYYNTEGFANTANGFAALYRNTTGFSNVANGVQVLPSNTTGHSNTANGTNALFSNTTGSFNTALGNFAGGNLTTGDNNIDIGNLGVAAESDTIRIGDAQTSTFIAGISGQAAIGGDAVLVTASGKLGTVNFSSQRFKDQIKPMDKASEAILALKPVTFRYKREIDPGRIPQFGLVAEEVDKVSPDLVKRDAKGEVYTVRYEAVNAMLLNEFLKEHRNGQKQDATIAQLKSTVAQQQRDFQSAIAQQQKEIQVLTSSLNAQASQLRKVSGQFEMSRSVSRLVVESR